MTSLERPHRPYTYYDQATSVCASCLQRVEAKILIEGDLVIMEKWCPQHGRERVLLADDAVYWRAAREDWLKPAEMPFRFQTPMKWGCPYDCGLCPDHQQHACVAIVEVSDRCNLNCPACFAMSGTERQNDRSLPTIEKMLDGIVRAEHAPDVVQISGGEPTIHPEFFEILDAARRRPIRHLMVNTNGLRIASEPDFAARLAEYMPAFEVYLQFDSLRDEANQTLRGARLLATRLRALDRLEQHDISTTLVMTVAAGVNDDEIGDVVRFALQYSCVRGVTFQPIEQVGRVVGLDDPNHRITLTGVRRRIAEQSGLFEADDILPVPCHPDVLAMGYALRVSDQITPLTRAFPRDVLLDAGGNTIRLEAIPELREKLNACLSTGLGPTDAAARLDELMCCLPRIDAGPLTYKNVFRLLIVRFQDAHDFDVRSAKRSCIHFAQPDGRLIPFETFNLFHRDPGRSKLAELRARVERSWSNG